MMKRISPCLLAIVICIPVCFGTFGDADDGYLTSGEYDYGVELIGDEQLIVMGGGADSIDARDYSYIEVQYTSIPLSNNSGIYDIFLYDNSELLYLDGITEEITVRDDATAVLKGGRVDYITLYRQPTWSSSVTIYCQEGYLKDATGISGLWADGSAFNIEFINVGSPYPPTANYVFVETVPEPVTLALLGFGGLLLRRRQS